MGIRSAPNTIAGTASYMSPEQVRGQAIDTRSDIFSFGILLHELLSGEHPFTGDSSPDVMSAILRDDPRPLPAHVPAAVARIVTQCSRRRSQNSAGNRRRIWPTDLRWAADLPSGTSSGMAPVAAPTPSRERWFWLAGVVAALALGAGLTWAYARKSATDAVPYRFQIFASKSQYGQPALSPDGQTLVFVGADSRLWLRPLQERESKPLAGTESAAMPFWSPDQKWIAFFAAGRLRKIPAAGGVVTTFVTHPPPAAEPGRLGTAASSFSTARAMGPLLRVGASGGVPVPVTKVDTAHEERSHGNPTFLSDGHRFVFFARTTTVRKWLLK